MYKSFMKSLRMVRCDLVAMITVMEGTCKTDE